MDFDPAIELRTLSWRCDLFFFLFFLLAVCQSTTCYPDFTPIYISTYSFNDFFFLVNLVANELNRNTTNHFTALRTLFIISFFFLFRRLFFIFWLRRRHLHFTQAQFVDVDHQLDASPKCTAKILILSTQSGQVSRQAGQFFIQIELKNVPNQIRIFARYYILGPLYLTAVSFNVVVFRCLKFDFRDISFKQTQRQAKKKKNNTEDLNKWTITKLIKRREAIIWRLERVFNTHDKSQRAIILYIVEIFCWFWNSNTCVINMRYYGLNVGHDDVNSAAVGRRLTIVGNEENKLRPRWCSRTFDSRNNVKRNGWMWMRCAPMAVDVDGWSTGMHWLRDMIPCLLFMIFATSVVREYTVGQYGVAARHGLGFRVEPISLYEQLDSLHHRFHIHHCMSAWEKSRWSFQC